MKYKIFVGEDDDDDDYDEDDDDDDDDEEEDRRDLETLLRPHNFEVTSAENGEEAYSIIYNQQFEKVRFDLLITDVEMPLVGGVELVELLRHERIWLPVIFVSGSMRPGVIEKLASCENLNFMAKPVDEVELLSKMNSFLKGKALGK